MSASSEPSVSAEPTSSTGGSGGRPTIMATRGVVSSGHYLATQIGLDILKRGGNAMDAAAAVGFALAVLKPHQNGIGGEVPMLVYSREQERVWAVSGNGPAPREATLERFLGMGLEIIPGDGFLPAIVSPAVSTWITLLEHFGTMKLADVLSPAVALAEDGLPMYDVVSAMIGETADRFRADWPWSAEVFLPGGRVPEPGSLWKQPRWAATFRKLLDAEAGGRDRESGLRAAHDAFYRGGIARNIVRFCRGTAIRDASGRKHTGLLSEEDFHGFKARVEEPVRATYRGIDVFKCGPWTQGPVLLQTLNLLEGFDLRAMGHNSPQYIHTVVECMKLAYADREYYYGDPDFAHVPLDRLLSKGYARERARLVDSGEASLLLRPGGYPPAEASDIRDVAPGAASAGRSPSPADGDTTKLEVIDARGNMVSATPSGGWLMSSPVVPDVGFPLGTRGQMFSLRDGHPNRLEPGKRPRSTLTPSLALKDGKPYLSFGSPGGDCQDQWALEFFLNVVEFGMSLQQAVEAPTFWTLHFPGSFYPRTAEPGSLKAEGRIGSSVLEELAGRGHRVETLADWAGGNTLAACIDPASGIRHAAASPRLEPAYAAGW